MANLVSVLSNQESKTSYDERGNVVWTMDRLGNKTYYEYDNLNRLVRQYTYVKNSDSEVSADDEKAILNTNIKGLTETERSQLVNNGEWSLRQTCYTYDAFGNQKEVTDSAGNTITYTYDNNGILSQIENADKTVVKYVTDYEGQVLKQINVNGGTKDGITYYDIETSNKYDAVGNILESTDAVGNTTKYEYDHLGNVIKETSPEGNTTRYEYLANGKLPRTMNMMTLEM